MRDATVLEMHHANAKRDALLYRQFEFLRTRQEAAERVLRVSKFWYRVKWVIWPTNFIQVVDAVQRVLLDQAAKDMREAAAKPNIQVVHGA